MQYVSSTDDNCELIRILPNLYPEINFFREDLLSQKERYFIHFPLLYAYKRKLVIFIGNYSIPNNVTIPKYFRSQNIHPKTNRASWYIFEEGTNMMHHVKVLTDDNITLSDWDVWNDTLLKERLEQNWSLEGWR